MKSNDVECEHMIEKTGVIGGLDLPEKAEHSREKESVNTGCFFPSGGCSHIHLLYVSTIYASGKRSG